MDSLWDRLSLRDLQASFDARQLAQALLIATSGQVLDINLDGDGTLSGAVLDRTRRYQVSVRSHKSTLSMTCGCGGMKDSPCVHALALMVAWIAAGNPDLELEERPVRLQSGEPKPPKAPRQPQLFPRAGVAEIRADWEKRLGALTVREMRDVAVAHRVRLKGTLREQVLEGLVAALLEPGVLDQALERLQPDARRVLDLLRALAGLSPRFIPSFAAPYLEAALANGLPARPVDECLEDLRALGFYHPAPSADFFPLPLALTSRAWVNPALFKPFNGHPGRLTQAQPFRFTRLALRLLLLAQAGQLRCTPWKGDRKNAWPLPAEADLSAANQEIYPEPAYLESSLRNGLARGLGLTPEQVDLAGQLLESEGFWSHRAPEKLTARFDQWLELSPQEQSRQLFLRALELHAQVELDLARRAGFTPIRNARYSLSPKDFLAGLALARHRLARLLACLPVGQWVETGSLLRTLHGLQPGWALEFSFRQDQGPRGDDPVSKRSLESQPAWAVAGGRRLNPLKYEDWLQGYGQFHLAILTGTFSWLGLVDVAAAAGQGDQPAAVRLSEFGEFLLGRRADFPEPAPAARTQPLAVRADWTLDLDLDAAPLDLINLLVTVAAPVAEGKPDARRLAYRLTDGGLGRAFEAGWTMKQVTDRLAQAAGAPLSPRLLEKIAPLWERFGRVQIYEDMTLLEFADDFCLPELLAGTSLSQILLATFSPRLVAVRAGAAADFITELQAKGFTPKTDGGNAPRVEGSHAPRVEGERHGR